MAAHRLADGAGRQLLEGGLAASRSTLGQALLAADRHASREMLDAGGSPAA